MLPLMQSFNRVHLRYSDIIARLCCPQTMALAR